MHAQDARIREMNQTRQDAVKRIDELVAQLDRLEERLAPPAEGAARSAGRRD